MLKSKFIGDILKLLLDGDDLGIKTKPQIDFITESDYEYTGAGVFVSFEHLKGIENFRYEEDVYLNGVEIHSNEIEQGAECILFFKNGLIDFLEIWSYSGEYPNVELKTYELKQVWEGSNKKIIRNENDKA